MTISSDVISNGGFSNAVSLTLTLSGTELIDIPSNGVIVSAGATCGSFASQCGVDEFCEVGDVL